MDLIGGHRDGLVQRDIVARRYVSGAVLPVRPCKEDADTWTIRLTHLAGGVSAPLEQAACHTGAGIQHSHIDSSSEHDQRDRGVHKKGISSAD